MDEQFNPDKQHTLSASVSISGTGLHTGVLVDMTLKPANPGYGIQFQRIDLPNKPVIKADCDLVTDTSRGTTLQVGDAKISTVEHILAALVGLPVKRERERAITSVQPPRADWTKKQPAERPNTPRQSGQQTQGHPATETQP
jgi:hypothetical protein